MAAGAENRKRHENNQQWRGGNKRHRRISQRRNMAAWRQRRWRSVMAAKASWQRMKEMKENSAQRLIISISEMAAAKIAGVMQMKNGGESVIKRKRQRQH